MYEALAEGSARYPGCCGSVLVRELLSATAESRCFRVTSQGLDFILLLSPFHVCAVCRLCRAPWWLSGPRALFLPFTVVAGPRKRHVVAGSGQAALSLPGAVPAASQASPGPLPSLVGTGSLSADVGMRLREAKGFAGGYSCFLVALNLLPDLSGSPGHI